MATDNNKLARQPSTAVATYGEWTPEQMEADSKEMESGGSFWKVSVGAHLIRMLPPKLGWKSPFMIQYQHFIELAGLPHKIVFCCPVKHEARLCLACAKEAQLLASKSARDRHAAKSLTFQKRMMANVVVDPENAKSDVSVWTFGKQVYEQLKSIRENPHSGGDFMHPVTGFNLTVNRRGTGMSDTKYVIQAARNSSPLANMDWIELQTDLTKFVRVPTQDQQQRLFDGEDPRDVWADDDGAGPDGDQRRRRSSREREDVIDVDAPRGKTAEDDLFDDEVDVD